MLLAILLFRLWFLQVLSGQQYLAEANNNRLRSVKIAASRGSIFDRTGAVLVDNRPGIAVGIRLMDVPQGQLNSEVKNLAGVLHVQPGVIRCASGSICSRAGRQPMVPSPGPISSREPPSLDLIVVKEDVSFTVYSHILEHQASFPGVEIQKDYLRDYPQGDLAAQVLGNVGQITAAELKEQHFKGYSAGDEVGQLGLKWTYDRWLRGRDGISMVEVDAAGQPKANAPVGGGLLPLPGDTLVTTIDAKVQAAAEQALVKGIEIAHSSGDWAANGGAAVVMDVRNGQILAMASNPTYDPRCGSLA